MIRVLSRLVAGETPQDFAFSVSVMIIITLICQLAVLAQTSLQQREAKGAYQVAAPTGSKITTLVLEWVVQDLVARFDSRGVGVAGSFSKCALA